MCCLRGLLLISVDYRVRLPPDRAEAVAQAIAERHLLPYESLETSPLDRRPKLIEALEIVLNDHLGGSKSIIPTHWEGKDRNATFLLHAWDPVSQLLTGYSLHNDGRYLALSAEYAEAWLQTFQIPAFQSGHDALVVADPSNENFAWYDMAVGQRIYRLAYILDIVARRTPIDTDFVDLLVRAIIFHQELLCEQKFFRAHSNHGLFQALGQLAAARRFPFFEGSNEYARLADERLALSIESQFDSAGVHREHSPRYQFNLIGSLIGARDSGLLEQARVRERLLLAECSLMWMVTPRGGLAAFGDSEHRRQGQSKTIGGRYQAPALQWLLSGGQVGTPPPSEVQAYTDAGYAFARIYSEDSAPTEASYLAQLAAFHSRVHKHADHLTFIWEEGLLQILTDPGQYGYAGRTKPGSDLFKEGFWYSDPRRIYIESTRAHNCVEIDHKSYPRLGVKPFGSALKQADRQGELVVFHSEVVHQGHIRQRRTLVWGPGHFLLALDWLHDRAGIGHEFRQWFQFAPNWSMERRERGYRGNAGDNRLDVIDLLGNSTPSEVFRGQEAPELQGWVSERPMELTPAPSVHFAQNGSGASFATLFVLDADMVRPSASRVNASLSRAMVSWNEGEADVRILIERGQDGHVWANRLDTHAPRRQRGMCISSRAKSKGG